MAVNSASWALYSRQDKRLNMFHVRTMRRILGIKWSAHITNKFLALLFKNKVLSALASPACTPSRFGRRVLVLGHIAPWSRPQDERSALRGACFVGRERRVVRVCDSKAGFERATRVNNSGNLQRTRTARVRPAGQSARACIYNCRD